MSSRPYPFAPSPSNLSHTLTALTHINTSLLTGIFPTAFKQARVTPLLKKPTLNTSLLENYRPISLLPFIAKTLEQVVFNQVSWFLSQNKKLNTKRSGFRSGHSTETALLSVTETLRTAKADSKSSVLILLHYCVPSYSAGTWLLLPLLRWWHTALSLFSTRNPTVAARISGCLADISAWMKEHRYSSTWQRLSSCLPCHTNSTAWLHDPVRLSKGPCQLQSEILV